MHPRESIGKDKHSREKIIRFEITRNVVKHGAEPNGRSNLKLSAYGVTHTSKSTWMRVCFRKW